MSVPGGVDVGGVMPQVPLAPLLETDPVEVGGFRLLGRLGSGGMGVAFLAQGGGGWVVVKVVRSELADSGGFRVRLARELEAMGRVGGGVTAGVVASDVSARVPWFAMEFIPGVTLDRWVAERGVMGGGPLVGFALGLAEAVVALQGAGVVHRDLKPGNVMVLPGGGVRVVDFGVADLVGGTQVTRTGVVVGSVGWLAPEQVRGDEVSAATDVHAWGACVVFAASGVPPFGADTSAAALYRVLEFTPVVPVGVGEPLRGLVGMALAKDPVRRPPPRVLVDRLRGVVASPEAVSGAGPATATAGAGAGVVAGAGGEVAGSEGAAGIGGGGRWWVRWAVGVGAVAALVGLVVVAAGGGGGSDTPVAEQVAEPVGEAVGGTGNPGGGPAGGGPAGGGDAGGDSGDAGAGAPVVGPSAQPDPAPTRTRSQRATRSPAVVSPSPSVEPEPVVESEPEPTRTREPKATRSPSPEPTREDAPTREPITQRTRTPRPTPTPTPTPTPIPSPTPVVVGVACQPGGVCRVGDRGPGGGVVFFDAGSSQSWGRYLEAAPQDAGNKQWCALTQPGFNAVVPTGTGIGSGRGNTAAIIGVCGVDSAAGAAAAYTGGGKADWFLPSKDELNELYKQRGVVGGLASGYFWGSSQYSGYINDAWSQGFDGGYQYLSDKDNFARVRPVRAF